MGVQLDEARRDDEPVDEMTNGGDQPLALREQWLYNAKRFAGMGPASAGRPGRTGRPAPPQGIQTSHTQQWN